MTTTVMGKTPGDWVIGDSWEDFTRDEITLDTASEMITGTVLALSSLTNKYVQLVPGGANGTGTFGAILWENAEPTGVAATGTSGAGTSQLDLTSVELGVAGNYISFALVDPGVVSSALAITVTDELISVSLETDGGGAVVSTADEVKTALDGDATASGLVTVVSGGTGVVVADAEQNLAGGIAYTITNQATGVSRGMFMAAEDELIWPDTITANQQATVVAEMLALNIKMGAKQ